MDKSEAVRREKAAYEELKPEEYEAACITAQEISDRIKPLLAGNPPQVQGCVLADLVATFIAGHIPPMQSTMFKIWSGLLQDLLSDYNDQLWGESGNDG